MRSAGEPVRYRTGQPEDALCLGVLALQVFLDTYAMDGMRPDLAREALALCSPAAFEPLLRDPARRFILAERAGHLLGFAECAAGLQAPLPDLSEGLALVRLYVQRHAHGEGLGKALLEGAEELARERRLPLVWLTAWADNAKALGFYRARGYEDMGATDYVFEDQSYENRVFCRRLGEMD